MYQNYNHVQSHQHLISTGFLTVLNNQMQTYFIVNHDIALKMVSKMWLERILQEWTRRELRMLLVLLQCCFFLVAENLTRPASDPKEREIETYICINTPKHV